MNADEALDASKNEESSSTILFDQLNERHSNSPVEKNQYDLTEYEDDTDVGWYLVFHSSFLGVLSLKKLDLL